MEIGIRVETLKQKRKALLHLLHLLANVITTGKVGSRIRQGLAVLLSTLMILIPLGQSEALGQYNPPAGGYDQEQPAGQPLTAAQLDQLVAPIALYPDALVAQVLAAATYPTQVVEADRWLQTEGNLAPEQIATDAENQPWDASVKALTAFPTVLAQMDRNLQWTTDLGNAYYNQPQDVMTSIQAMRERAKEAGQLRNTPQQVVSTDGGVVTIVPANPAVVYVPVYNPWGVYGAAVPVYPGYYYAPSAGAFWGGLAVGFGAAVAVGFLAHWGWGWGHWGIGWPSHSVFFNRNIYLTHSTTVINRGFGRPGGPPRTFAGRGAFPRSPAAFNRPGGSFNRPSDGYHGAPGWSRAGGYSGYRNLSGLSGRPAPNHGRPTGTYGGYRSGPPPTYNSRGNYPRPSEGFSRPSGSVYRSGGPVSSNFGNRGFNEPKPSYSNRSHDTFGGFSRPSQATGGYGAFRGASRGGNSRPSMGHQSITRSSGFSGHGGGYHGGGSHASGGGHGGGGHRKG